MTEEVYIAIRRSTDGDEEWVDLGTASYDRRGCELKSKEGGGRAWMERNPVVAVRKFTLQQQQPK